MMSRKNIANQKSIASMVKENSFFYTDEFVPKLSNTDGKMNATSTESVEDWLTEVQLPIE